MLVTKDPTNAAKLDWERFANDNQGWINEGLEWEGRNSNETHVKPITPVIFRSKLDGSVGYEPDGNDADDGSTYYLPTWQNSPVNIAAVNFNPMYNKVHKGMYAAVIEHLATKRHGTMMEASGESLILQPVFKRVDKYDSSSSDHDHDDGEHDNDDNPMVAVLRAVIPWSYYFKSILPGDTPPMYAILTDSCGRFTWSYMISGYDVTRISDSEDLHDPKYDYLHVDGYLHHHEDAEASAETGDDRAQHDMDTTVHNDDVEHEMEMDDVEMDAMTADLEDGMQHSSSPASDHSGHRHRRRIESHEHDGHRSSAGICSFTYSLYPTQEFEDTYKNNFPIYATLGVVLIFVVTSLVFILYDVLVARRFRRIEASATRSNAIVSSLFPAQVRDRLMETADDGGKSGGGTALDFTSPKLMSPHLFGVTGAKHANSKSAPIADLFPSATVMFADIASFTAWSSVREPTQVFMLLEEVYNSFDSIAKRRRVFKVETIGDSYGKTASVFHVYYTSFNLIPPSSNSLYCHRRSLSFCVCSCRLRSSRSKS
jgi:Adenylate and Guanylate cyclase catalytic domain